MTIDLGATLALENLAFFLEGMNAWWRLFEMLNNGGGWKRGSYDFIAGGDATVRTGVSGRDADAGRQCCSARGTVTKLRIGNRSMAMR